MKTSDQEQFAARLAILAEVYAEPMSDTRLEAYVALLDEHPLADLIPALEACAKMCRFFPKPIDILDAITSVQYDRQQTQTKRLIARAPEDPRQVHCTNCEDTGFERGLECPGDGRCHVGHCGQGGYTSYPHGYTRKCFCRATNPVLAKQRERMQESVRKREERHAGAR